MLPPAPGAPRPPGTHTAATLQPLRTRKEKSRRRKTPDPNALLSSPGSSRHQFLPPDPSCCCCRDRKAGTAKLGRRQELTVLPPAEGSPAPGAVRELTGGSGSGPAPATCGDCRSGKSSLGTGRSHPGAGRAQGGLLWRAEMAERTIPAHRGVLGTASPGNASQWHLQGDSIPVNPLDGMDGIHSELTKK